MAKGQITNAVANGNAISITFLPSAGNIRGRINLPAPENLVRILSQGRPIESELQARLIARKMVGLELDIPLFGQVDKKTLKKDLKKRGLWNMRDKKFEIKYVDYKDDKKPEPKYSEMWEMVEKLNVVETIEEFDTQAKNIKVFIREGVDRKDIAKEFETLGFIARIEKINRLEVR